MKLLIASDIHGSAYYCRKLLEAREKEESPRMLLLGDILYHGPRNDLPRDYAPREVIAMLNPLKNQIWCVRGNCEAEVDQMVLHFPVLADYCLLPVCADSSHVIYATHGHIFNEKNLPPMEDGDVLLHGHTHVPRADRIERAAVDSAASGGMDKVASQKEGPQSFWVLNPGSTSIPKGGSETSYAVLEDGIFSVKKLESGETYLQADLR